MLLFILWMTNLFNFMDCIDGISSVQCIIIGFGVLGATALSLVPNPPASIIPFLITILIPIF